MFGDDREPNAFSLLGANIISMVKFCYGNNHNFYCGRNSMNSTVKFGPNPVLRGCVEMKFSLREESGWKRI